MAGSTSARSTSAGRRKYGLRSPSWMRADKGERSASTIATGALATSVFTPVASL
jgi:hypothetical protein